MGFFLPLLLIPVIGYFSWVCARSYGWWGFAIFSIALSVLTIQNAISKTQDAEQAFFTLFVLMPSLVLALIAGGVGVAKWRAAREGGGQTGPKMD